MVKTLKIQKQIFASKDKELTKAEKDAYGKRMARNIYAPTREECEEKLAILIKEMKAEIAEQKAKLKNTQ